MGGCLLYPPSLLQLPSFSAFAPPRFRNPFFPIQEISLGLSIRADDGNNKGRIRKNPYSGRAPDDDAIAKSSLSPNKEEILALFKRIQSSISKGETTVNQPKRRTSKNADDNKPSSSPSPSSESILEVLHQARTQRKGKTVAKKGDKFLATQKDAVKKEESAEYVSTRPPSSFTRRSPIPTLSSPREEVEPGDEAIPEIARDEAELKNKTSASATDDEEEEEALKLEEMKLHQLKEVAKSKGIKGYSKLRKSELIELLLKS